METLITIDQLAQLVANNAKSKQWLSAHFSITHNGETYRIGVKSFGKWVQRMELNGIVSNVPEQKTLTRMRELFTLECTYLLRANGAKTS